MTTTAGGQPSAYAVLLLADRTGELKAFPGVIVPRDQILVSDLRVKWVNRIEGGEVIVLPPRGSGKAVVRVGVAGTRVFPGATGARTVLIKLSESVASASIPLTLAEFQRLLADNHGDVGRALRGQITTELMDPPFASTGGGQYQITQIQAPPYTLPGPPDGDDEEGGFWCRCLGIC